MMRVWLWALTQLAAVATVLAVPRIALAECGNGVFEEDSNEQCDDGNVIGGDGCSEQCRLACTEVVEAATQHTCGHGEFGPFVTQPAQAYPGFVFTDVSTPHTYFTVTLSGEPGKNRSAVLYWPVVDGAFAFYLKENYPLALYDSSGTEVPVAFEHAITTCGSSGAISWVKVYDPLTLESGYDLVIGPTSDGTASFAIEYLPSFQRLLYRDRDRDGAGGDLVGRAWCTFEPGDFLTVSTDDDCDDDDPGVYPGAPEACDGKDNDCAGNSDVGHDVLCSGSVLGNRCVEASAAAICGCGDDSDCTTGETCDPGTHRCEAIESGNGGAPGGSGGAPDAPGGVAGVSDDSSSGARGAEDGGSGGESEGSGGDGLGGSADDSGGGDASRDAGRAGRGGTSGQPPVTAGSTGGGRAGTIDAPQALAPPEANGCSCRTGNHGSRPSVHGLVLLALASLWCRRRVRVGY